MPVSILRYPGGKSRAVKIILPLIPNNTTHLVSPFMGGGSVEHAWSKENINGQVSACDFFKPLAIFWQQVRENPEKVAEAVRSYFPLKKDRFYTLQQTHLSERTHLEIAAQFYVLNRSSFSGFTLSGGMSPGHARFTESSIIRLRDFRMPNVDVDAADMFNWLPATLENLSPTTTFIYLDPPYWLANSNLYGHKGNTHREFDHVRLAHLLSELNQRGFRWLLSYNDTPELRSLYSKFVIQSVSWTYGMNKSKNSSEVLISNT